MSFSPEFERDVLTAMMRHPDVFSDYQEIIDPKVFGVPAYRKLWHILREFHRDQKELPTPNTLVDLIAEKDSEGFFLSEDTEYILSNIDLIMNGTPVNENYVLEKLISWVKEKRLRSKITQAVRGIEKGEADIDDVIRMVREAEVTSEVRRQVEEEDFAEKMMDFIILKSTRPNHNIIPTGLNPLDQVMGGGPKRGYKCVLMGPPGHGKTTTAIKICGNAVEHGLGSYYLFNDDTEEEIYDRFTSYFSGIPTKELVDKSNYKEIEAVQAKLQKTRGRLGLREIDKDTTPTQVRRMVEKRIELGHPVDVLVIDHIRNMRADDKSGDSWYDIGEIFTGLMGIALDFDLILYVIMHTKRSAEGRSYLDNSFIGLSYEPVKDANFILAIWRAREDMGSNPSCRMQITKHRGGPGLGALMRFGVEFDKMRFLPQGEIISLDDGKDEEEGLYDPTLMEE